MIKASRLEHNDILPNAEQNVYNDQPKNYDIINNTLTNLNTGSLQTDQTSVFEVQK